VIDTRDSINPDSVRIDVVGGRRRRRRPPLPSKSASCRTPEDCLATPLLASFLMARMGCCKAAALVVFGEAVVRRRSTGASLDPLPFDI
jgi:hypothetical protein